MSNSLMDTKIYFNVKALGFPVGKIYKMYIWLEGNVSNSRKYIDDEVDNIKDQLKDVCVVHSIEHLYTTYTNTAHKDEEYGVVNVDSESNASTGTKTKTKTKKVEPKPVTDINKIDLPNIDKDDLVRLRIRTVNELFKREHSLSDDVFNFYLKNKDEITVDEAKQLCEEHGSVDMFLLEKRKLRKMVEGKISTS